MPQFMLILHSTPNNMAKLSPTDIQAILEKYNAWTGKLAAAGKLVAGHKLTDDGGKVMAKTSGKPTAVDGPYSEAKEVVGGYFLIKAASYDEAVQLASDCPHVPMGRTEVRQIDFMGEPES
jgi:hypothetical protein